MKSVTPPHPLNFWIWALFLVLRGGDGFRKCHHTKISLWAVRTLPGPSTLQFWQIPWENPDDSEGWSSDPQSSVPSDPLLLSVLTLCPRRCYLHMTTPRSFVFQKRIYFRLRNKATGLFMSTNGNLEDLKLLRIQVMEDVGADDQIWIYQEGCIKCRVSF